MLLWLETIVTTWLAVGVVVAVPFLTFAVGRVIEGAAGSSLLFRLLMLPAATLLWPVVLHRWLTARRSEPNA